MIIGKARARNATFLGRDFLVPPSAPPSQPGSAEADPVSGFDGRLGLRRICEQLEQSIEELGDDVLLRGERGAEKKIAAMFGRFAGDADKLVAAMAPGADRDAVAQAARRDGDVLLREAVTRLDEAGEQHAVDQLTGVADGLARRVAADPSRLAPARKALEDLADAGELSDARADAVKRDGVAALEAAARGAAAPGREPAPTEAGHEAGPEPVPADAAAPAVSVEQPDGAGPPVDELPNGAQGDQPGRNEILQASGFEFVSGPEGDFWQRPDGGRASPRELRDVVVAELEERATRERWSSARILTELHRAKQGLPQDDERNVETAFAFLPFLAAGSGTAATGTVATTTAIGAGVTAGGVLKSILAGLGLAALAGVVGKTFFDDTPHNDIEQIDETALATRPEADEEDPGTGPVPLPPPGPDSRPGEDDDDRERVTVYRVEGVENRRVLIDDAGGVTIVDDNGNMLHLNFGQRKRAIQFLRGRIDEEQLTRPVIKSFLVPKSFLDTLRAAAIKQRGAGKVDRQRVLPRKVDPKFPDQFELPPIWLEALRNVIEQGTGVVEAPEDVGIN